jgi:hypothetical protein
VTAVLLSLLGLYLSIGVMFAVVDMRKGEGAPVAFDLLLWPFTVDIRIATWLKLRAIDRDFREFKRLMPVKATFYEPGGDALVELADGRAFSRRCDWSLDCVPVRGARVSVTREEALRGLAGREMEPGGQGAQGIRRSGAEGVTWELVWGLYWAAFAVMFAGAFLMLLSEMVVRRQSETRNEPLLIDISLQVVFALLWGLCWWAIMIWMVIEEWE